MTIIVEDGTVVANANSYVSEADLTTYATERGITLTGTLSVLLIKAMDYIEGQDFIGYKSIDTQPLQWPRYGAVIDGYEISSSVIPKELKDAQMSVAVSISSGADPLSTVDRSIKSESLGPMSTEYMDSASDVEIIRSISNKLRKLLRSNGGSMRALR